MSDALDELLRRARLIEAESSAPYTEEEIAAGWQRLMEVEDAKECARCHRRGTRKVTIPTDDGMWPVCTDKDDCHAHQPKRVRRLTTVKDESGCTCLDPECRR